jgi:hypothetical protein
MRHRRILAVLGLIAAFAAMPLLGSAPAAAQDATPVVECTAPELPPGTPTPMEEEGSPVAESELASPEAEVAAEAAEAEAQEEPPTNIEGPVSETILADAEAGLQNILACVASGDYLKLAALMTPNALAFVTETGNPYDVPLAMEGVTPMRLVEQGEAVGDQNHRVGLHLIFGGFFNGPGVLSSERWYLVKDGDFWKLDEIKPVTAPADFMPEATIVEVQMVDYAFALSQYEVPAGPVILRFTNTSYIGSPHVAGIVTLTEGYTSEQVIQGESLPEDELTGFYAGIFVPPGESTDVIFEDMQPGEYTMACDFETEDHVAHYNLGMVAQFRVV